MKTPLAALALVLMTATGAEAGERPVPLKDAPGRDAVEANCASCHSLDYTRTNASFMDRKTWEAEINKMVNVFGAPIAAADAKIILDYLVKNYGVGG
ncbi:MAG: cytochrome c [Proteobacteria bacterium]|nr:cytochrome c [Pseudomonadota bacterium]MBI3495712.1 cytochrome c [Pseudomonadota bacterium]